jgi:hypothetical protein
MPDGTMAIITCIAIGITIIVTVGNFDADHSVK